MILLEPSGRSKSQKKENIQGKEKKRGEREEGETKANEFLSLAGNQPLFIMLFSMKKMFSKFPVTKLAIFYTKPNLPKKKTLSKHSREPEV